MKKFWGFMGDGPLVGQLVQADERACFFDVQNQRTLDDLARGVAAPITRLIFDLKEGSVVWRLRR